MPWRGQIKPDLRGASRVFAMVRLIDGCDALLADATH